MNSTNTFPSYQAEVQAALQAVRDAARICRSVQATVTPEKLDKKDKSPVTIADYGSQAVVCRVIGDTFPFDPIIAEEDSQSLRSEENEPFLHQIHDEICRQCLEASKDEICRWIDRGGASEYTSRFWTLDPIDGTKGFLRGEQYAISLALVVDGELVLGVLGCPNLPTLDGGTAGALLYAVRGHGSYEMPLDGPGTPRPIHVSSCSDFARTRLCESVESGHSKHDTSAEIGRRLGILGEPVRLDSQAKYAVVARGEADVYLRLPTREDYREMIWDHAGGALILEESGGRVTDVSGAPLQFTHGRHLKMNRGVIATNGLLHDRVLSVLKEVGVA